jgi:hypothetical protein
MYNLAATVQYTVQYFIFDILVSKREINHLFSVTKNVIMMFMTKGLGYYMISLLITSRFPDINMLAWRH